MSTNTQTASQSVENKPASKSNTDKVAQAAKEIADKLAAQKQAELAAVDAAWSAFMTALQGIGADVHETLAANVGLTVDKFGYPDYSARMKFRTACVIRKTKYNVQDKLCRIAVNAVGAEGSKLEKATSEEIAKAKSKFVTGKASGTQDGAKAQLKMKDARAEEIGID